MSDVLTNAMATATREILADADARVFGGGRPDGRRPVDAFDINCGFCEPWADRVEELCVGAEAIDPGNLTGDPDDSLLGHVFVRFRGRFYDAECSSGVVHWRKLPLFVRDAVHKARAKYRRR